MPSVPCPGWPYLTRAFGSGPVGAADVATPAVPTIYAVSTPPGRAAIAIVRISGTHSQEIADRLRTQPGKPAKPLRARVPALTTLRSTSGLILDRALILLFEQGRSYTGEDLVEFHLHGSPAVVRAVLAAIAETGLARHAEAGEFTKRAFHSGALDLAQVEGVRDLLNADTELQRRAAVAGASGELSGLLAHWRGTVVAAMARLAALIDFADDNDLEAAPATLASEIRGDLVAAVEDVRRHVGRIRRAEIVTAGLRVALLGPPNAGKSSLVNALVNRAVSIVSDVAGTTRDIVEVSIDLGGHKVILSDTAGIREIDSASTGHDQIEALGIARARERAAAAHVVLAVAPANAPVPPDFVAEVQALRAAGKSVLLVRAKSDLEDAAFPAAALEGPYVAVSSVTGAGMPELLDALATIADAHISNDGTDAEPLGASQRALEILQADVLDGLEAAVSTLDAGQVELAYAELSRAADGVGKITGRGIGVNEVLGVVFSSFCIGK